ncbi:MAG TPA: PEP/pyruvate-binding domain-containing protein, partial [Afifellaceae bacterium]|nr:PEP/pyruvate-binding domain-containing protein [Afifellaceae bacterium]
MTSIIADTDATDARAAGNKAANLASLAAAGFDVPPFFVIDPERFDGASAAVRRELAEALGRLGGERFAVRSSSSEEDGEQASFAGQFASFLDISADDVPQFASRVIASASGAHINFYRQAKNLAAGQRSPAVLVQRMVKASASGVAFAADVSTGDSHTAVVAAVAGTGDRLVGGDVQGDTWWVRRNGRIANRAIEGAAAVLSDRQVRQVARLVRRVSRAR